MNKKTIGVFTPDFSGGGAEFIAVEVANRLVAEGHSCILICENKSGPFLQNVDDAVSVFSIGKGRIWESATKFYLLCKKHDIDSCLTTVRRCNVVAGLAIPFLKKAFCCLMLEVNTFDTLVRRRYISRSAWLFLMRIAYSNASAIVSCSHDVAGQLKKYVGINHPQHMIIGNPALPDNFQQLVAGDPSDWPAEYSDKEIVLISMGRLEEQKNYLFLVKAFKSLYATNNSFRLLLVGSGSQQEEILRLIRKLDLENVIKMLPFILNPYPILSRSKVFVMSSKWEGFGNVFIMAAALGLPIVSSNAPGGVREIVTDNHMGALYEQNDVNGFINAVNNVLRSIDDEESIERRKNFAARYRVSVITEKYINLILNK